jgi:hypothetical protein
MAAIVGMRSLFRRGAPGYTHQQSDDRGKSDIR